jgi:putative glutamine amidotransferase
VGDVVSSPPLVGVSTSEVRRPEDHGVVPQGEPRRSELALGERYLDAVRSAGGLPVILAPVAVSAVDPLLERLDAVCLSGGPDLHPSAYGAEPHPELGPTEPELDLFELALARRAVRRGLPVLAVCRGAHVLNVALGGTLHQHLPDLSKEVEHRQKEEGRQTTHDVKLVGSSRIAKLIGRTELEVNSFHHQAPATTAPGLRVVGRAADDTVEALESTSPSFVFGVQWHAECLVERPEHHALFEGLVKAGAEHAAAGLRAA